MKIIFQKVNTSSHSLAIIKDGLLFDEVTLHTQTYFLHDIAHYCAETELQLKDGFWGMIHHGHYLNELSGKNNALTETLREVERIVGPLQSLFSGHLPLDIYCENMQAINSIAATPEFGAKVTGSIGIIMNQWKYLRVGQALELEFDV